MVRSSREQWVGLETRTWSCGKRHGPLEASERRKRACCHHCAQSGYTRLRASFFGLKKTATPGVDEMTGRIAEHLEVNLLDLHPRVHTGAYRALPSRREYMPKADGRQRPLGIDAMARSFRLRWWRSPRQSMRRKRSRCQCAIVARHRCPGSARPPLRAHGGSHRTRTFTRQPRYALCERG
jgi:hypothetical protein